MKKIIFFLFFLFYSVTVLADTKMDLGLDVYNNKAQCGTCHTLKAAGEKGDTVWSKISRKYGKILDSATVRAAMLDGGFKYANDSKTFK